MSVYWLFFAYVLVLHQYELCFLHPHRGVDNLNILQAVSALPCQERLQASFLNHFLRYQDIFPEENKKYFQIISISNSCPRRSCWFNSTKKFFTKSWKSGTKFSKLHFIFHCNLLIIGWLLHKNHSFLFKHALNNFQSIFQIFPDIQILY